MITPILDRDTTIVTQTGPRGQSDTETPSPPGGRGQDNPRSAGDLVQFESRYNVGNTFWGREGEFAVPASEDRESAILMTPGISLSFHLQRVLPSVAPYTPLGGSSLEQVMERLLGCDVSIRLERTPSSPSTQVELSADEWMAQVRAWASSHPRRDHIVDDSRESIYGDRV